MNQLFIILSCINLTACALAIYINYTISKENQKLLEDLLHAKEMIGTIRGREIQAREQNAAMVTYLGELIPYELRPRNL